ncbi:hypothetical protein JXM83_00450 [Candidatus Woesearchaeota archaeon]|nr:hypothetical protein [Candidatus Woesearchaeota archaeon]
MIGFFPGFINEIIGLKLNIRRASIIYLRKDQMIFFLRLLKSENLFYEVSDFYRSFNSLGYTKDVSEIKPSNSQIYSIYISKDMETVKELKTLDCARNTLTSEDFFLKMGALLGYPKCCTMSYIAKLDSPDFLNDSKLCPELSDDVEPFLRLFNVRNGEKVNYLLNDFLFPHLRQHIVCNYACEESIKQLVKITDYLKKKFPIEYSSFEYLLKQSLMYVGNRCFVSFIDLKEMGNSIYSYSMCTFNFNKLFEQNSQNGFKIDESYQIFKHFLEGDSFENSSNSVKIFKDKKLIHEQFKRHKYDCFFIHVI